MVVNTSDWDKGLSREQVVQQMNSRLKMDLEFDSGKIIGSMCTLPHSFARQVFSRCLDKNIGDPGLCPGTIELEKETIEMLGRLLSLHNGAGYIVSGGTEANILALWTAKAMAKGKGKTVLVPESAHFSFDKAASLLDLNIVKIPLNSQYQVDVNRLKQTLTADTIALVGVAGSTPLGVVDPVEELAEIAEKKGIYLHVDAAFGGFVLPFLDELGYAAPLFDFRLPGVSSVTIDPHKMGMCVIPAGGIIYRDKQMAEQVKVAVPYLAGGESAQATIVGTRPGAAVLTVWGILKHLGWDGYTKVVKTCMELTCCLKQEIERIPGLHIVTPPTLNILGIIPDKISVQELARYMRARGWAVSLFSTHIRVVLMPHLTKEHLKLLVKDLKQIMQKTV